MSTQLTEKQLEILEAHKKDLWEKSNYILSTLLPLISQDLKQIRTLTKDIALIAAAIATFYLPVITTEIVQIKFFAFMALFYLFAAIVYSIYHLSEVLPKEVNGLAQQLKVFGSLLLDEINRVNKVLIGGDLVGFRHSNSDINSIEEKLKTLETESMPDKSLNNLRMMLLLAFIFIILSFLDLDKFSYFF